MSLPRTWTFDNIDSRWTGRRPCNSAHLAPCDVMQPDVKIHMTKEHLLVINTLEAEILLQNSLGKPSLSLTLAVMIFQGDGTSMRKVTSSWTPRTTMTTGRFVLDASSDITFNHDTDPMTSPSPRTEPLS